jgi:tagaturonate reductase
LYERFRVFDGASMSGVTIVPTELIVNNGVLLKKYVLQHAANHHLGQPFSDWLQDACDFCDSLVDKIVTGAPSAAEKEKCWANWGYQDDLCIDAEPFMLWAIECNERARKRLQAAVAGDETVILSSDITPFREQKLRLLNGGHTISVSLAYLTGFETVGEMMNDPITGQFARRVILKEILPTVLPICDTAESFANAVIDRFCNPFIIHPLLNITLQNTAKMQMRNALTFKRYYEQTGQLPSLMCLGFAGYLLFAKAEKVENGQFFGKSNGNFYKIKDDKAVFLNEHWQQVTQKDFKSLRHFVESVLNDERIFEKNAFDLPNFASKIATYLQQLLQQGAIETLKTSLND